MACCWHILCNVFSKPISHSHCKKKSIQSPSHLIILFCRPVKRQILISFKSTQNLHLLMRAVPQLRRFNVFSVTNIRYGSIYFFFFSACLLKYRVICFMLKTIEKFADTSKFRNNWSLCKSYIRNQADHTERHSWGNCCRGVINYIMLSPWLTRTSSFWYKHTWNAAHQKSAFLSFDWV